MDRIAVFPGSFDPITRGHESIIRRALPLFDKMIVAIGENGEKRSFFPLERRLEWLHQIFGREPGIIGIMPAGRARWRLRRDIHRLGIPFAAGSRSLPLNPVGGG